MHAIRIGLPPRRRPPPVTYASGDGPSDHSPPDEPPLDEAELDAVQRDFLDNPHRRQIVELLAERPGLNKSQIADDLGLELNTVRYHLERLEAVDLVVMEDSPREGEVVCFLFCDTEIWEDSSTRILFGGSRVREAALLILQRPGITAEEIGDAMELTSGGVHHHLTAILDNHLVERFRLGRAYRYYPTPTLEAWYDRVWE